MSVEKIAKACGEFPTPRRMQPRWFASVVATVCTVIAAVLSTASPADAVVDTNVQATQSSWYDGDGNYHVIDAWMNIDRTNHVIRSYGIDEIRTSGNTYPYHFVESAIMQEGIKNNSTKGVASGTSLQLTAYSNPTTPCGGGYGFRAQTYAYAYAYTGALYEATLYSGLARTACT